MRYTISVEDRQEGELIEKGLADPEGRAIVKIIGALAGKSKTAQRRILSATKVHMLIQDSEEGS